MNYQELGIDSIFRRLKQINKRYLPDIICLSETKKQNEYVRAVGIGFSKICSSFAGRNKRRFKYYGLNLGRNVSPHSENKQEIFWFNLYQVSQRKSQD